VSLGRIPMPREGLFYRRTTRAPRLPTSSSFGSSWASSSASDDLIPSASAICLPISRIASLSFVCAWPDRRTMMGEVFDPEGIRLRARATVWTREPSLRHPLIAR
jgi:hypothetical protein